MDVRHAAANGGVLVGKPKLGEAPYRAARTSVLASMVLAAILTLVPFDARKGSTTCLAEDTWRVAETESSLSVMHGKKLVLAYRKVSPPAPKGVDPIYQRSGCLHPVNSPLGATVTAMFPADHLHQHGVFSAWVKTTYDGQSVNFWDLAGRQGRVLHERVVSKSNSPQGVGFVVDLLHRVEANPPVDVLRERWKITVRPGAKNHHCFDLETVQSALTDKPLIVNKYHYGGVALRGPTEWVIGKPIATEKKAASKPSRFLNNFGSDRLKGNHQRVNWVALTGVRDGKSVCVAVLSHAENFRAPQAARLHPTKPYFCYAPCVDGEFRIDRDHPYRGKYRFLITDDEPDAAWLNQQWRAWCGRE